MATNPVVNTLTFIGSVAGQASIQAQGIAGNLTFLLPNTAPIQGQLLDVLAINGNNVFLGWSSPQSLSNIPLSDLAQSGATTGEFIAWNGSQWAPSSFVPGSGTVTSVALTAPAEFTVAGSPITTSGTLAISKANQSANTVWAGPATGAPAAPAFRALVAADIGANTVTITAINSKRGNGGFVQLAASGTAGVAGDVVTFDANGNTQDSGTLLSSLAPIASPVHTGNVTLSNGDLLLNESPTANITVANGSNLNINGNGGLIQIATTGGIGIAPFSGTTVNITAAKFTTTITDNSNSTGTSGQVLTAGTGGQVVWATDTESVTSVFTRTGAVTAQSGDYSVGQVTGAAPLASPALTGTPTAPTAAQLTNSTQIATTAYADVHQSLQGAAGDPPTVVGDRHTAVGTASLNGTTAVTITLTGASVFSAANTYAVFVGRIQNPGASGGFIYAGTTSGSQFTLTSTNAADTFSVWWMAVGKNAAD